ncbi:peptidyl-prolyl cis-trans isomerase [Anaeromassilibacillus senegalensis]|uniref:peptidylprolyl isomerase n=1 Tax=Anaeromassilibacillus senegalensis TaxID=1673717 RepID=UPI000680C0AE|nr:peptidylprolyl isomerase [Anaeromassilibacillus senegalensis]
MKTGGTKETSAGKLVAVWLVVCLLAGLFAGCGGEPDPYQTVGEIDGRPVALGELQLFVDDVRQQTNSYFKKNHQLAAVTEAEWRQEYNGEAPVDYAIRLAMEALVPYKVVEKKLMESGGEQDFSYQAFVSRWEEENQSRQQKKEAGEVVYGPIQYTKRIYYDYLNDEYQKTLESSLRFDATEQELQQLYDENPTLFQAFGSVSMQCAVLPQDAISREQAETARNGIREALEKGSTFADGAEQAGIAAYIQERTFTAQDLSSPDVSAFPEVEDAVYSLPQGGMTELIDNDGLQWLFFYCESREEGGRTPFAACRDALEEIYREQAFAMELEQAQSSAQITIYEEARRLIH